MKNDMSAAKGWQELQSHIEQLHKKYFNNAVQARKCKSGTLRKEQIIITIAKKWNIPHKIGMTKADLIIEIQKREGYSSCFHKHGFCDEKECLWMDDCIPHCM